MRPSCWRKNSPVPEAHLLPAIARLHAPAAVEQVDDEVLAAQGDDGARAQSRGPRGRASMALAAITPVTSRRCRPAPPVTTAGGAAWASRRECRERPVEGRLDVALVGDHGGPGRALREAADLDAHGADVDADAGARRKGGLARRGDQAFAIRGDTSAGSGEREKGLVHRADAARRHRAACGSFRAHDTARRRRSESEPLPACRRPCPGG